MKKKKDSMTIMIVPHSDKKTLSFFLDSKKISIVKYGVIFSLFLIVLLTFNLIRYINLIKSENYKLLQENENYKEMEHKIKEYNQQKKQLEDKINEVEKKLSKIEELEGKLNQVLKDSTFKIQDYGLTQQKTMGLSSRGDINRGELLLILNDLNEKLEEKEKNLINLSEALMEMKERVDSIPGLWPVQGEITSDFGYRKNPFGRGREFHDGVDISAAYGTKIKAAANGVVVFAGYKAGYGYTVIINHNNGIQTMYSHASKILVRKGQKVLKGQDIAAVGSTGRSTGAHLHFSILHNGRFIDPLTYIKKQSYQD
ncbi:M23 family metallopeptidase [Thermovenabulum gondwanense]|uniref:Murein DD-endopeptidase MepM n=1 Tax=Thermovenabulum gondwanense TaxID=520767 RepID=A0A162MSK6_9FIRM|nr:M23 family metallopeptidase [Thermovenabulum gondwanense]KYO67233.1 Murein DD-endopeptidase MepM [Thermovenabulum gondwanense]